MYYPDQRAISPYTQIRREVTLPDEAAGVVRANDGQRVDIRDVVINGVISNGYVIVDAMAALNLKKPDDLEALMRVNVRDVVKEGQVLAGKSATRGRRVMSPIRGIVSQVREGRIILQKPPTLVDLEAGVRGRITAIKAGRGVVIETVGARVQGIWGNGRNTIATLLVAPEGELTKLRESSSLEARYGGSIILTRNTLTKSGLRIIKDQNLVGVIAPSMDATLRSEALELQSAIMLTDGFGDMRMTAATFNLLNEFNERQVTVDAETPGRWEVKMPEVVVNVGTREERPSRPNPMLAIRTGMTVRMLREPNMGQTGRILDLPKSPILLDNGLRVLCAQVELVAGEQLYVPLANLEVLSR